MVTSPAREWRNRLLLVLLSVGVALLLVEGGFRFLKGPLGITVPGRELDLLRSAYPAAYDPELGWVPRPGGGRPNIHSTRITITDAGVRSNGQPGPAAAGPPVLVVGDSTAFGDEVSDDETFSAYLEQRVGVPVINGGVFGYGIDQSYLRALRLSERFDPRTLVFSLITDDISRAEMDIRTGVGKPYFAVDRATQTMRRMNVPVPRLSPGGRFLRRAFAASDAASFAVSRLFPEFWMTGTFSGSHKVHRDGLRVLDLILRRLDELAGSGQVRVIVLLLDAPLFVPEQDAVAQRAVAEVEYVFRSRPYRHLELLVLYPLLNELKLTDRAAYRRLLAPQGHFSPAGNRFVAARLSEVLQERP